MNEFEEFNYFRHWRKFENKEIAIVCPKEFRTEFLRFLMDNNYKWASGTKLLYDNDGEGLLVDSNKCYISIGDKKLNWGAPDFYEEKGKQIVEFKGLT